MPYQLTRPYLKDDRKPIHSSAKVEYLGAGFAFDYTTLSDDAYGNRITEPGMLVCWNATSKKLEPYDHENGSPTLEPVGVNLDKMDIRNGDVIISPGVLGLFIARRCWCINTGGTDPLVGSALVTAIDARIAAGNFEMIHVRWADRYFA